MPAGRPPDYAQRHRLAKLRSRGLTLKEIGRKLGVTRQAVSDLMKTALLEIPRGVPCSASRRLIPTPAADRAQALCLDCLRNTPSVTQEQRLLAYRLAAGLSRGDVAHLAGVYPDAVCNARGAAATARTLARIARVLGMPGAPSLCEVRLSPRVWRSLWVLLDLVGCGPRGLTASQLARRSAVSPGKVMGPLQWAGLVTRAAADITLLDVAEAVGESIQLELPKVSVRGRAGLHRRLQAACDETAEAGRAVLLAVSLADLLDGKGY
jgi:transcriptional regulator with XRE-family HTH domain